MKPKPIKILFQKKHLLQTTLLLFGLALAQISFSQIRGKQKVLPNANSNLPIQSRDPNNPRGNQKSDTSGFKHRDDLADSITIYYRHLDSLSIGRLDSSINDYSKIFTVPAHHVTIGNNGNAAFPILFTPLLKPGWDQGLHAFDVYKFTLAGTRFYKTTRPYTQMSYLLATGKEQVVKILHTQNISPNWNAGIEYNLISTPGTFQNQNVNHNNYRFFSNYQGKKKRYAAYMVMVGNKLSSGENGGIKNDSFLLDPNNSRRIVVPVNLVGDSTSGYSVFSSKLLTGNEYSDFTFFLRQSYDFGIKDSVNVNDSTTEYLFYPKFRMQHTFDFTTLSYKYMDMVSNIGSAKADSAFYNEKYNIAITPNRSTTQNGLNFFLRDQWKILKNDFSIKQFPQTKNQAQFIEAGLRVENIFGSFDGFMKDDSLHKSNYFNLVLHGEYRNKTRNKKWDALLQGEFYTAGYNAADFRVLASLTRYINPKLGDVQFSFQNVNRTPSYIFNSNSGFKLDNNTISKKENITVLSIETHNRRFNLMARNISIANYTYFKDFYHSDQYDGLVNITQFTASSKTPFGKHWNLYSDFSVQQTAGNNPIKVPLFYTRQRLAFEGKFFKNLNLSTGADVSYNTPYKANNYSPVLGSFFPQDEITISNLPTIDLFFNFTIKSFSTFVKAENLNTATFNGGLDFLNNSFAAPLYPTPGFLLRVGIQWRFVN